MKAPEGPWIALGRRAAAILGIPYGAWRNAVLTSEAIRVLLSAQNRPARLAPGCPIWARVAETEDAPAHWAVYAVADGTEQVWIRDEVVGVPPVIDPTETALSVTWVGRGEEFVVHRNAPRWAEGGVLPATSAQAWRHALSSLGTGPLIPEPPKRRYRRRKVLDSGPGTE